MAKKINNFFDLIVKVRAACVSKDETRVSIMGIHFAEKEKRSVATNGHILSVSKILYQDELKGLTIDKNFTVIGRDYPSWQAVLPSKFEGSATFYINPQFCVKSKNQTDRRVFFYADGSMRLEKKEGYVFCLDGQYLEVLKDMSFKFSWCNALSPVQVELDPVKTEEIYIIMPIKA